MNGLQVEQLQVVHSQLVLFPEDVPYQRLDRGKITLHRFVVYRLIEVQELVHYRTVIHMVGHSAETVILWNSGEIMLAIVLPQGLVVPHDAFLYIAAVQLGLVH